MSSPLSPIFLHPQFCRAYYNTHENWLTECDALTMDIHHVLEQQGRANHLRCFSFNGSGGIWRLDAIRSCGGFSSDTITEDLDLSYKAFIAGYRFVYVPEIPQLLELPSNVLAYKQQKNRWNKGYFQVCRKSLRKILKCKHLPLAVRIEAVFHLTNPVTSFLGLVILALSPILVLAYGELSLQLTVLSFMPCIPFILSGIIACYAKVPGPNRHYLTFWQCTKRLVFIPMTLALSAGTCIYDTQAIFQGLFSNDSTFLRTPKAGGGSNAKFDFFEGQDSNVRGKWQQRYRVFNESVYFAIGICFAVYLGIVPFLGKQKFIFYLGCTTSSDLGRMCLICETKL